MKIPEQTAENRTKTEFRRPSVFAALMRHEAARLRAADGRGLWSKLFSVVVAVVLALVAGYVVFRFAEIYVGLREGGRIVTEERLSELLSAGFSVSALFALPSAAAGTSRAVFADGERDVLAVLPIRASTLAAAKVLAGVPRQLSCYVFCALTFSVACALAAGKSVGDVAVCVLCSLAVFPVVPLAGTLLAAPLNRAAEFAKRHAVLSAAVSLVAVGALFALYAAGVDKIAAVLSEGNPRALFNAERTAAVSHALKCLYPACFAARAATGDGAAAGYAVAVGATATVLCGAVALSVLPCALRRRAETDVFADGAACKSSCKLLRKRKTIREDENGNPSRRAAVAPDCLAGDIPSRGYAAGNRLLPKRGVRFRAACGADDGAPCVREKTGNARLRCKVFCALLRREVVATVGTGRGFALFSPLIIAPLVAGAVAHTAVGAAAKMLGFDVAFPIALTAGAVAAVFTCGASASAVTADKSYFRVLGTLPVYPLETAAAKAILYCGAALATGMLSGVCAALAVGLRGALAAEIAAACGACALSTSLFALSFDFARPDLRRKSSPENGGAAFFGCMVGLSLCIIVGGTSAALGVRSFAADGAPYGWLSRVVPLVETLVVFLLSVTVYIPTAIKGVRSACVLAVLPLREGSGKRQVCRRNTRKVFLRGGEERE